MRYGRVMAIQTLVAVAFSFMGCGGGCWGRGNDAPKQQVRVLSSGGSGDDVSNSTDCAGVYRTAPTAIPSPSATGTMADVVVADMDGDGNTDIVVARGNDDSLGNIQVLFGPFDGGTSASWTSDAGAHYRRLAVADVDHDGYLDIAAAIQTTDPGASGVTRSDGGPHTLDHVYDCENGTPQIGDWKAASAKLVAESAASTQTAVAIFRNHGDAGSRDFGATPAQSFRFQTDAGKAIGAFSVDFGDSNGDGYADLAVGGGALDGPTVPVSILVNDGKGRLLTGGAWQSLDHVLGWSVRFMDVDADGLVDLFVTTKAPGWGLIFHGIRAAPGTALTNDARNDAGTVMYTTCADVVASDNFPIAGGTTIAAAPNAAMWWCSGTAPPSILALLRSPAGVTAIDGGVESGAGLAAATRFADADGDGRLDLIVPTWTPVPDPNCPPSDPVAAGPVYAVCDVLGSAGTARLGGASGPMFHTQGLALGDVDGVSAVPSSFTPCDGGTSGGFVVSVPDARLRSITGVTINGKPLAPTQYLAVPGSRLVYIAGGFACSAPPTVSYSYSSSMDVVLANQNDSAVYVFMHQ